MRRRASSQSDLYFNEEFLPNHDPCLKSQGWPLNELVETSHILLDERTSAKRFQQLYSHLKFAYTQLQESHADLESRYTSALHEWLNEKKFLNLELIRLSSEKRELEFLCFQLQKSALSPVSLQLIKWKIGNALKKKSEDELARATKEIKVARTECLYVTEELEKLKTDYEQLRARSKSVREMEVLLRESERQHIAESHDEVVTRLSSLLGSDTETLAALYRENSQMCAQYHLVVGEAEKSKRLYDTQMCELKNELIRAIEGLTAAKTDRATLVAKCESLSEEMELLVESLASTQVDLKAARQRIVDCERAKLSSEKHFEGRVRCLTTELNDCRLVAQRERVEVERQRDQLAFQVQDLASQLAVAIAKFEEVEILHQQREQEMAQRESDLRKTMVDSTEESRNRSAEMLRQLEHTQSRFRELTAQHKDITQALAESETLRTETQKKLSLSEARNSALKDELAMARHELRAQQNQIQSLERSLKEITSSDEQISEKDYGDGGDRLCEMAGVRESYLRLLERFKSEKVKLIVNIRQLNAELISKSCEAEQHRQEIEKLRQRVPQAEYQRIKSQLEEFQRRKESYWFLLNQANQVLPGCHSD
ncbi:coiled coil domain containing protein 41 [Echinococcus multilocularis]|uniref:Coiled coil domain containing protein 41 n=1 Tax=Echinococcus multilocularis TaxID=6211 RepID=A0A068Y9H5_ECHMU|nr:coiled coil domain containing protein 41 [Echinococcus multilocularis]